jgi:alpha-tubulin suppressor-like RCC1 family protein
VGPSGPVGPGEVCPANPVVALRMGAAHGCVVRADGGVLCWGRNDQGQLGDTTTTPQSVPVAVSGVSGAGAIALGDSHTCAVASGAVLCWGGNDHGQLGYDGTTSTINLLASPVPGVTDATDVAAGSDFSCAIIADGRVRCWGDNSVGQLGNDGTEEQVGPAGGARSGRRAGAGSAWPARLRPA